MGTKFQPGDIVVFSALALNGDCPGAKAGCRFIVRGQHPFVDKACRCSLVPDSEPYKMNPEFYDKWLRKIN